MVKLFVFFGVLLLAVFGSAMPQLGLGLGARTPLASMGANANTGYYGNQGYGEYSGQGYGTNTGLGGNVAGVPLTAGLGLGR